MSDDNNLGPIDISSSISIHTNDKLEPVNVSSSASLYEEAQETVIYTLATSTASLPTLDFSVGTLPTSIMLSTSAAIESATLGANYIGTATIGNLLSTTALISLGSGATRTAGAFYVDPTKYSLPNISYEVLTIDSEGLATLGSDLFTGSSAISDKINLVKNDDGTVTINDTYTIEGIATSAITTLAVDATAVFITPSTIYLPTVAITNGVINIGTETRAFSAQNLAVTSIDNITTTSSAAIKIQTENLVQSLQNTFINPYSGISQTLKQTVFTFSDAAVSTGKFAEVQAKALNGAVSSQATYTINNEVPTVFKSTWSLTESATNDSLGWWKNLQQAVLSITNNAYNGFYDAWVTAAEDAAKAGNWYEKSNAWINSFIDKTDSSAKAASRVRNVLRQQNSLQNIIRISTSTGAVYSLLENIRTTRKYVPWLDMYTKVQGTSPYGRVSGTNTFVSNLYNQAPILSLPYKTSDGDELLETLTKDLKGRDTHTWTFPNNKIYKYIGELDPRGTLPSPEPINLKNEKYKTASNNIIKNIIDAGPNFSKNMYTVSFVQQQEPINSIGSVATASLAADWEYAADILNSEFYIYNTRLQGISIPQMLNDTFDVEFVGRKFSKVKSQYKESHTVDLIFELDQHALMMKHFSILSGQRSYNGTNSPIDANTFFVGMFKGRPSDMSIIVTYNDTRSDYQEFNPLLNMFPDPDNDIYADITKNHLISTRNSYKSFVFEDVQFLGFGNSLDFKRDSADRVTLTVKFRFKRLTTVDTEPLITTANNSNP